MRSPRYEEALNLIRAAAANDSAELDLSGKDLTSLPPEIGSLTNILSLNLINNNLTSLPPEIGSLTNLQSLKISGNRLTSLPPEIALLTNLQSLNISDNRLTSLPEEFGLLTGLKGLNLSGNHLTWLPEAFGLLSNLQELIIGRNRLTLIPEEIGSLTNLRSLTVSDNPIARLPEFVGGLDNLEVLNAADCNLSMLPASLGQLSRLRILSLGMNNLEVLSPEIAKLRNLQKLNLAGNNLSSVPEFIRDLPNLRVLALGTLSTEEYLGLADALVSITHGDHRNKLSSLPDAIGELARLEHLDLAGNQLEQLPASMAGLSNLQQLYLHGNDALGIPPEILGSPPRGIMDYDYQRSFSKAYEVNESISSGSAASILAFYFAINTEPTRRLNEAKLILVGQSDVGKTSLVKRLIDGTFDPDEKRTEGINIRSWGVQLDAETINLNLWDFGGQEVMHATHQFFLTQRSIYLLVLNSRDDRKSNRVDYWLKMIESFGGDSPVIVVCNQCDEQPMDLDWTGLQRKFPMIKAFVRQVSCQDDLGIDEVSQRIQEQLAELAHLRDLVPASWFQVKDRLTQMKVQGVDYLTLHDYRQLCQDSGISQEQDQDRLVDFLNDLGVMLHYGRHVVLTDLNILNPEWVTNGVYSILNNPALLRKRDGVVGVAALPEILDSAKYPQGRGQFILSMMQKFELCFEFEGTRGERFLIPDLLSEEERDTGGWSSVLAFQYHYDVLPGSIITRFIVRMHPFISKSTYWKNGVVLVSEDGRNRALVRSDEDAGVISIIIDGHEPGRREFLAIIRADFLKIHATPARKGVEERVPLPDNPEVTVQYNHLRLLEQRGISDFVPEGATEPYLVRTLLDGIEDPAERARSFSRPELSARNNDLQPRPAPPPAVNAANMWAVGLFWLFAFVVVAAVIVTIIEISAWYAIPTTIIGALLTLSLIGILTAHQNGTLTETGYLTALKEFYGSLLKLQGSKAKGTEDAS